MSAAVYIRQIAADYLGISADHLYHTWPQKVADGELPEPMPRAPPKPGKTRGGRPKWSKAALDAFFGPDANPRPMAEPVASAPRGRPTLGTPPKTSSFAALRRS